MRLLRPLAFLVLTAAVLGPQSIAEPAPRVGSTDEGTWVPSRNFIRPAGETIEFAGRPVDLVVSPDGETVYLKDNRGFVVVDAGDWEIEQELSFGGQGGSMHGMALSPGGKKLYATTAQNRLVVAAIEDDSLTLDDPIALPGPGGKGNSHALGIALAKDGKRAYVCLSRNNTLGVVDLEAGKLLREIETDIAPWDVVLAADGKTAYVSCWGGRRPKEDDLTADSAGTEAVVDERGVGASGTVAFVDLEAGTYTAVETGLHASDLVLDAARNRLYVANANSDTVSIIDTEKRKVLRAFNTKPAKELPFGSMPNALALTPDGKTLYAANAGNNAIAVVEVAGDGAPVLKGFIPAGWFPGALALHGDALFIANVKGVGSRSESEKEKGWHVYWHRGSVQRVGVPTEDLAAMTAQVKKDAHVPEVLRAWERRHESDAKPAPVPAKLGDPSVFEHVVYVIKENRTYDQIFGELPQAKGDPELCIFPRKVTPNHHALAEKFVLLDNYYCNGVNSADGHSWATEGNVTDHLEKAFGGFTRSYTFGDDALTYSSSGFIWDQVLGSGLSFRNYGEMDYAEPVPGSASFMDIYKDFTSGENKIEFSQKIGIDRLRAYSARNYPGWNMRIPDVLRADRFIQELKDFEEKGTFPNLVIVYLPQDHASGTSPGMPTPRAHVADNDLALGRVVEAISKSSFWPKTCIFVNEDDPQAGFDHVDGHRSICLVVSPYTKRGAVVSEFFNQTSVLHTIARMLGVAPLNQQTAGSPVMAACFTGQADLTPYTALPNEVALDELNPSKQVLSGKALHWAEVSLAQNFEVIDGPDDDLLNRVLWHAVKGVDTPYPAHLAGAHGAGLAERGLIRDLDWEDEDDD